MWFLDFSNCLVHGLINCIDEKNFALLKIQKFRELLSYGVTERDVLFDVHQVTNYAKIEKKVSNYIRLMRRRTTYKSTECWGLYRLLLSSLLRSWFAQKRQKRRCLWCRRLSYLLLLGSCRGCEPVTQFEQAWSDSQTNPFLRQGQLRPDLWNIYHLQHQRG